MSMPVGEPLVLERDDQGRIVGGRRGDPANPLGEFSIERRSEQDRAIAIATFSSIGELVLRVTSEISVANEFISLDFRDNDDQSVLWWRMNFSNYDVDHLAHVQMFGRGVGELSGIYDPRSQHSDLQLIPDMWLTSEQLTFLGGFRPAFDEMLVQFERDVEPDRELIDSTIANSRFGALGRIACRAFAVMGGAAMGAVVGGPPGVVIGAGVGSVASEVCSKIP